MQNPKKEAIVDEKSNKNSKTTVQEHKVDKGGMSSNHGECCHSSDELDSASQSEESHLSMITYSYSPAPAPGGVVAASSIEEQPTFEDSITSLTLAGESTTRRYDHICFKKCSNILKNWERKLGVGKYNKERKERGSRHFFFTQLRRFLRKIGMKRLAEREQLFVNEMNMLIRKEKLKQQKDGENPKSKQYILEFNRAIKAYRLFIMEEYEEAFKEFYGFKEPGFKQINKMEQAYKQFLKKLAQNGEPTGSEQESLGQQSEMLTEMSNLSDEVEVIEVETEEIGISVQLENLVSDEELTLAHISEIETELFEVDFDKIWSEDLNDDKSLNDLF